MANGGALRLQWLGTGTPLHGCARHVLASAGLQFVLLQTLAMLIRGLVGAHWLIKRRITSEDLLGPYRLCVQSLPGRTNIKMRSADASSTAPANPVHEVASKGFSLQVHLSIQALSLLCVLGYRACSIGDQKLPESQVTAGCTAHRVFPCRWRPMSRGDPAIHLQLSSMRCPRWGSPAAVQLARWSLTWPLAQGS